MSDVKIIELKPVVLRQPIQPRCQGKLSAESTKWRESRVSSSGYPYNVEPWDQCSSQSSYNIDGKTFCRKHAGYYLLDLHCPPKSQMD